MPDLGDVKDVVITHHVALMRSLSSGLSSSLLGGILESLLYRWGGDKSLLHCSR